MSKGPTITAEKRALDTKAKHLREDGFILGSIYGHGFESTPIKFEYQAFRKAYRESGDSTVLVVKFEGKEVSTLVHEVQYHPLSDNYIHVDFLVLDDKKVTKAPVPLVLEGLAPAVKNLNSVLITPIHSIEIECLPKHLVKEIIVNIESLEKYHDSIKVSDLSISDDKNITVITDSNAVIVTASTPKGGVTDDEPEAEGDEKTEKEEASE